MPRSARRLFAYANRSFAKTMSRPSEKFGTPWGNSDYVLMAKDEEDGIVKPLHCHRDILCVVSGFFKEKLIDPEWLAVSRNNTYYKFESVSYACVLMTLEITYNVDRLYKGPEKDALALPKMCKDHYEGLVILGKKYDFIVIMEIVLEKMLSDMDPFVLLIAIKHQTQDVRARQLKNLSYEENFVLLNLMKRNGVRPDFTINELELMFNSAH